MRKIVRDIVLIEASSIKFVVFVSRFTFASNAKLARFTGSRQLVYVFSRKHQQLTKAIVPISWPRNSRSATQLCLHMTFNICETFSVPCQTVHIRANIDSNLLLQTFSVVLSNLIAVLRSYGRLHLPILNRFIN